jgi:GTP-binding protein Era
VGEERHRSGVAALFGRPNAGKSTLLNALLGEKLAIVTRKPQTTRSRVLGILSSPRAQILFVDTPGLHQGEKPLNRALRAQVENAAGDCDVALVLVDPALGTDEALRALVERLRARGAPTIAVATQCDRPERRAARWPPPELAGVPSLRTSGVTGEGVGELVERVIERLPEGPPFYPEDQLTDRPLRFLAAELVREVAFEELEQEVPYALAVAVQEFDESRSDLVRIAAELLVERESQKGIVIGQGGSRIRRIGSEARARIERLLGRRVHLALRVRCDPSWPRRRKTLDSLGYR